MPIVLIGQNETEQESFYLKGEGTRFQLATELNDLMQEFARSKKGLAIDKFNPVNRALAVISFSEKTIGTFRMYFGKKKGKYRSYKRPGYMVPDDSAAAAALIPEECWLNGFFSIKKGIKDGRLCTAEENSANFCQAFVTFAQARIARRRGR